MGFATQQRWESAKTAALKNCRGDSPTIATDVVSSHIAMAGDGWRLACNSTGLERRGGYEPERDRWYLPITQRQIDVGAEEPSGRAVQSLTGL